jgi:hypothetical protein
MKGITKHKLRNIYPNIAATLDEIYENNKKQHYWFFVNYNGKYKTTSGAARTVSLAAIIDVLNENGYEIDITIRIPTKP